MYASVAAEASTNTRPGAPQPPRDRSV